MKKWKLVPVEPDDAMAQAASSAGSNQHQGIGITAARDMLRAGIAAAPTPVMPELPEAVAGRHAAYFDKGAELPLVLDWQVASCAPPPISEDDSDDLYTADQVRQFAAALIADDWRAEEFDRVAGLLKAAQARIVELESKYEPKLSERESIIEFGRLCEAGMMEDCEDDEEGSHE